MLLEPRTLVPTFIDPRIGTHVRFKAKDNHASFYGWLIDSSIITMIVLKRALRVGPFSEHVEYLCVSDYVITS